MSEIKYVPSMDPLLYHYGFNFDALATVHPEQYPVWVHEHAIVLKNLAATRGGYVPVGVYLASLHTMDCSTLLCGIGTELTRLPKDSTGMYRRS